MQWMVPISITSSADPSKPIYSEVLDSKSVTITLNDVKPGDWIKVVFNTDSIQVHVIDNPVQVVDNPVQAVDSSS